MIDARIFGLPKITETYSVDLTIAKLTIRQERHGACWSMWTAEISYSGIGSDLEASFDAGLTAAEAQAEALVWASLTMVKLWERVNTEASISAIRIKCNRENVG